MPKIPENLKFRKKLLVVMSISLLVLHVIYTAILLSYSYIAGDFTQETTAVILEITLNIISVLLKSLLYGILLTVYDCFSTSLTIPFSAVAITSLILSRVSEYINYTYTNISPTSAQTSKVLSSLFTGFAIDLALIFIIFILAKSTDTKRMSRITFLAMTATLIPLFISLTQEALLCRVTLNAIMAEASYNEYPLTVKEILSIIWGFAQHIIKAASSFIVIIFINKKLCGRRKTI